MLQPPAGSLSDLLQTLIDQPGDRISVREMVDFFGHRAFGAVLFTFSVPNLLPLPPGSSTVLGLPLVLFAPQLALGVSRPWLPRWLGDRMLDRKVLKTGFEKLLPGLRKVERLSSPRLGVLFGPLGDRLIGLVCTLLALVLILPIPLGNMLPALAVGVLALGLVQRDGVLLILGYLLTAASAAVLVLSARAVVAAVHHLLGLVGL